MLEVAFPLALVPEVVPVFADPLVVLVVLAVGVLLVDEMLM